ncbi:MAG: NAD-dependent epimerase/dehydratase family protein [Hadesarchaea archaeon]|nr:NAD-dependent epimerase/dehydratase family protein [Hadesarchaea archaeon]
MKILVTGGAGFIGSNIVEALVERGDEVTVLDDFSTGAMENLENVQDEIRIIRGSCLDIPRLDLGKPELIFHMGIPSSSPMYRKNRLLVGEAINGFISVMELARENSVRVIYASSSSIYRGCPKPYREDMQTKPFDYYTEARLTMERLAEVYHQIHGVRSVGLRFFSVYGPHERAKGRYANVLSQFLWSMQRGERPVVYGDGEQTRDFVHVSDVVRACLLAAEADLDCEVINVGTGKETSFNEVIDLLNRSLGKSIEPKYVENPIKNYVRETLADITKAKELLGYEPSVKLEEGIKLLIEESECGGR